MKKILLVVCLYCGIISCNTNEDVQPDVVLTKSLSQPVTRSVSGNSEFITLPCGMTVEKRDSLYILGGDMLLSHEQIDLLSQPQPRSAVVNAWVRYWNAGKVYYEFAPGFSSVNDAQAAFREWESKTGIRFYPKTSSTKDYIVFGNSTEPYTSSSYLGMKGGAQNLLVWPGSGAGAVVHELGHAIGLFHEQCRSDRDQYVTIHWDNIEPKKEYNFDIYHGLAGYDVGPFDFESVMIYTSSAFLKEGLNPLYNFTMTKKDGSAWLFDNSSLSAGDVAGVKFLYGPPYVSLQTELDEGYQYTDYWDYYDANTLYFFSDQERKNRITTTSSRLVTIQESRYVKQGSPQVSVTSSDYGIIIPAGTTQHSLGRSWHWGQNDYGNTDYVDEYVYVMNPGF